MQKATSASPKNVDTASGQTLENYLYICANCNRVAKSKDDQCTFKVCSGCCKFQYCNRECLLADRRNHKDSCNAIKAHHLKISTMAPSHDDLFKLLVYSSNGDLSGLKQEISKGVDLSAPCNNMLYGVFSNLIVHRFYECFELLLQHNANPNVQSMDGSTPLYIACQNGYEDFVSLLLHYNANPNIRRIYGQSPLHTACEKGHDKCVSLLLQRNADPKVPTKKDGALPLHYACSKGYDTCIALLLKYNANPNILRKDGFSSLHLACSSGHHKCVSLLLENNADPNIVNGNEGYTPLYVACLYGYDECVSLLLQHNADPNIISCDGISPLHLACQNGHDKCVSLLLQYNAYVNIVYKNVSVSTLQIACQYGHDKCALLLLEHNADPNKTNDSDFSLSLYLACYGGYDKCVSLLLQHNANPNIINIDGDLPLHTACQYGHDKCLQLLLQHNADPNLVRTQNSSSALSLACVYGRDKCVSVLLQAGANMEILNGSGFTSFLSACMSGYLKCVALLVESGANIHARSVPRLMSALHCCCISRNVNLVAYILSLGVDVNLPDAHGVTPIQLCHNDGLENFVKLLIGHGADESTMKIPVPADLLMDNSQAYEDLTYLKQLRQQAKHCDYPDCCNECNDNQSLHACSSCRAVYYCSREHQEAHWKELKKLCKAIKK